MLKSHKTRWCDDCKMMVPVREHQHGRMERPRYWSDLFVEQADERRAHDEAQATHAANRQASQKQVNDAYADRLRSAVERLK